MSSPPGSRISESPEGPSYHYSIQDLPPDSRPRERLLARGANDLSDPELLAIILRTGTARANALDVASQLLIQQRGLAGLDQATVQQLCSIHGLGEAKAIAIKAAIELGKRLVTFNPDKTAVISSPRDVFTLLKAEMSRLEQEQLTVLLLNNKNRVVRSTSLYRGTVNSTSVRMSELFREAVRDNAVNVILAHNHPSGDPTPSPQDVQLTREAVTAGRLLEIDVLDHVVIGQGDEGYVSLKERGLGFPRAHSS